LKKKIIEGKKVFSAWSFVHLLLLMELTVKQPKELSLKEAFKSRSNAE
jgi:hypothetical protein